MVKQVSNLHKNKENGVGFNLVELPGMDSLLNSFIPLFCSKSIVRLVLRN